MRGFQVLGLLDWRPFLTPELSCKVEQLGVVQDPSFDMFPH